MFMHPQAQPRPSTTVIMLIVPYLYLISTSTLPNFLALSKFNTNASSQVQLERRSRLEVYLITALRASLESLPIVVLAHGWCTHLCSCRYASCPGRSFIAVERSIGPSRVTIASVFRQCGTVTHREDCFTLRRVVPCFLHSVLRAISLHRA
ncbi:hypothetical protein BDQ17DRAFT_519000 [Cyathus striatus]|nr:hypothetical protein BDQ17DRAFT_519000 [Cyathus striatus]